jgi:hypothetical protein
LGSWAADPLADAAVTAVRDVELVPVRELAGSRRAAQDGLLEWATSFSGTPLPPAAFAFYSRGGCYDLALALHECRGLPLELFVRGGTPTHCYAVDGDSALDTNGRRSLADARVGADEIRSVTAKKLRADLPQLTRRERRKKAQRAARLILEAG